MSTTHLWVTMYSHHFSVDRLTPRGRALVNIFAKNYVQYGWESSQGQSHRVALRVFAAATDDRTSYRFHINTLGDFREFLFNNLIEGELVEFVTHPIKPGKVVDLNIYPKWTARDYQIPIIEYLCKPEPVSKFVDLGTGLGKSFISMKAMAEFGKRIAVIIKPTYIEKWVDDIVKTYDIAHEDTLVIQGSAALMALLQMAKDGQLTAKVLIFSNRTFQNWVTAYEKYGNELLLMGYACLPHQYGEFLDIGVRLIDEAHQDWHFTFKLDLYTHVERSISLTATLINKDPFLNKTYQIAYPTSSRYTGAARDKYINAHAVNYRFDRPDKIRTTEFGRNTYSHAAFEKSVLRSPKTLNNYLKLIDYVIDIGFMACTRKEKKVLIFAATISMCTHITEFLKAKYPQYDVRRYVGEDEYSDLMDSDICVSTLGSAGTAVDIPNLTNEILTTAISSVQSNVQSLGRLRNLPDNHQVEFHYLVCNDIQKHLDYDREKKEMLEKRAKCFTRIHSGIVV